ncbi:MAG: FecR family protein [Schleiferiaceae bacterium]|nr:FecR family protein [Schleiferiaceae bacterium]
MTEENKHIDFDALLAKEATGGLSVEEKRLLADWINESKENKTYAEEMRNVWSLIPSDDTYLPTQQDTDEAWNAVHSRITRSRKVFKLPRPVIWAASFALILSIGWWYFDSRPTTLLMAESQEETIHLVLSDGSKVELLPYSQLSYPESFDGTRDVTLQGTARFRVESNKDKPFKVYSEKAVVEVVGTVFKVDSKVDSVYVEVDEGKVKLYANTTEAKKKEVLIQKGESAFILKEKEPQAIPIEINSSIDSKSFLFESTSMAEVLESLQNEYHVNFEVKNVEFLTCTYSAKFTEASLNEVLETIELVFGVTIKTDEDQIYIEGKGC